ncbi:hypothetical protein BB559_005230 [Furculomyces boomerangus]|uniref:Chromo domain-containing protein n=1 Tax=Furculomyces boomerangus TaxID=61424 RepID=A0A2T9Y9Y7_9FUNG|nr:hypothetical protein BB559_005230 [Furculomyces boomerangus]
MSKNIEDTKLDLSDKEFDPKEQDASENPEDDSSNEEGVYNVERLCDHSYNTAKRKFKYFVKWEGYPESDNTWEDEDNIMSEALLNKYWNEKKAAGILKEDIMNGSSSKLKKRTSSALSKTPARESKRQNVNGSNEKKSAFADTAFDDSFLPESDNWENAIRCIETVDKTPDTGLIVYVVWKDGKRSVHPSSVVNAKCPQKVIQFYEERLRFSGSPHAD